MADAAGSGSEANGKVQQPLARHREGKDAVKTKGGWFPLGYREGFSQWWANMSPAAAEHAVLSFIPYLQKPPTQMQTGRVAPSKQTTDQSNGANDSDDLSKSTSQTQDTGASDPYGPRRWQSSLVKLSGKDRAINEFSVERLGEDVDENLVILHGWGAGLGFFYKNFEPLSRIPNWRLYALDMLGMGRSSRPPFRIQAKDRIDKVNEAENFFIDALEEWRKERKIERFTLLGHSLGGYMSVAYCLKYPGRVKKLILASPVGIPEDPYAVEAPMPENETAAAEAASEVEASEAKADTNNFLNKRSANTNAASETSTTSAKSRRRPYPKWLVYLWEKNLSPFDVVRWSGPLGPTLVSGWTSRRFGTLPQAEAEALHMYSYSIFSQRGSGEYALGYVLAPGAFARNPLIRRIGGIGRQQYSPADIRIADDVQTSTNGSSATTISDPPKNGLNKVLEHGIPVIFMYGSHDWMDVNGGHAAVTKLNEAREIATRDMGVEEKKKDQGYARVLIVDKAGHHVYLDGYEHFNQLVKDEMLDVEKREKQLKR